MASTTTSNILARVKTQDYNLHNKGNYSQDSRLQSTQQRKL